MKILGISAFYHDSAAALIENGRPLAAAQEERFTRKKHDSGFPERSIEYCLKEAGCQISDLEAVVFYDKPMLKFERLLETYLAFAPVGFRSFTQSMPVWLKDKLFLKTHLKRELCRVSGLKKDQLPKLLFTQHHQSHAASAFYPSPFESAAVLCLDGVGEWATTSAWVGAGKTLTPLWEIDFPHSLGLLYSAFTYYTGFKVNSGEYKLMGLAPYGEPKYESVIRDNLIDLKEDGTFRLNLKYFNYMTGLTMTNDRFAALFGEPVRKPESPITQKHMDLAASIQKVTEDVVIKIATSIQKETGLKNLCLAGGVALNCVANGKLARKNIFENIWVQPAAGDAGGALGAALSAWHEYYDQPHTANKSQDMMSGSLLGPQDSQESIEDYLTQNAIPFKKLDENNLFAEVAGILASGAVVGWHQGRMEFGPRALGARSIIGDPRNQDMQTTMNLKIKYRESFRPFAPAVLAEKTSDYFEFDAQSPYMLMVAPVQSAQRVSQDQSEQNLFGIEKLKQKRSQIPAVTHVDYSARIQTVHSDTNPRFHRLLKTFNDLTDCPVLVNTSFNVRGEPIVCSVEDSYRCFMRTEMDYLVVENFLLTKTEQPVRPDDQSWKNEFQLD